MTDRTTFGSWLDRGFILCFVGYVLVPLAITAVMAFSNDTMLASLLQPLGFKAFSNDTIIRFPIRGY